MNYHTKFLAARVSKRVAWLSRQQFLCHWDYSGTPLKRTPLGPTILSIIQGCPSLRGYTSHTHSSFSVLGIRLWQKNAVHGPGVTLFVALGLSKTCMD